jgi:hypothetical protein
MWSCCTTPAPLRGSESYTVMSVVISSRCAEALTLTSPTLQASPQNFKKSRMLLMERTLGLIRPSTW